MIQASIVFENELQSTGAKLSIGVHEGASFLGFVKDGEYFDMIFGKDGQSIKKRLFKPTGAQPLDGETPTQAFQREEMRNIKLVTHLLHNVVEQEVFVAFGGKDYSTYMENAVKLLSSYKNAKVNILVVPGWKDPKYPDLPSYPGFLERHEDGVPTRLKLSDKDAKRAGLIKDEDNSPF